MRETKDEGRRASSEKGDERRKERRAMMSRARDEGRWARMSSPFLRRSSLFARRSSPLTLRSSLFALRSSLFALRSSPFALRSSLLSHRPSLLAVVVVIVVTLVALSSCAIKKVETSKSLYTRARQAQENGNDLEAVVYWKALLAQANREIEAGHYPTTNYFLRASAYFELGEWDKGFEDLKQVQPETLGKEEFWIYPLYAVMMGDYYSQRNMMSVAQSFYQAVLKKSSLKSSPIFLLALERQVNNSIKSIDLKAAGRTDAEKFRLKEYEDLAKDVQKYIEDFPFSSVSHFLLADLLWKMRRAEEALEHFLASLEMGLPTQDLRKSAEFQIANLLSSHRISGSLRSVLLARAVQWWGGTKETSIFRAGENTIESMIRQDFLFPSDMNEDQKIRIRYLGVNQDGKLKILVWEKL